MLGSSHPRKIKNIIYRLSRSPKSYIFKGVNKNKLTKEGKFNFNKYRLRTRMNAADLPQRPSKELIKLAKYLIPQSDNNKCLIKRESMKLSNIELKNLFKKIKLFFKCKINRNPSTGAYLLHSSGITKFLREFFIYEKSWKPLNKDELEQYYNKMIKFLEV